MEGISLRPSDAQAGGFLDDVDVVLRECRFVRWDYAGKAPESVALKITMEDDDGRVHEQYYSAGDPRKITPTQDGRAVVGVESSPGGLTSSTNAVAFITSLVNAGFPEDSITNDVGVFDGMAVHVNQVAQPKRPGLKKPEQENKTYLLVTKIVRMPGEATAAKPAKGAPVAKMAAPTGPRPVPANAIPTPTPSPAPTPGAEPSPDVVAKARATVLEILAQKGGAIPKQKLPTEAFRALSNDPDRNTIVTLVFQDAFLAQGVAEGAFGYDGTTVTLG